MEAVKGAKIDILARVEGIRGLITIPDTNKADICPRKDSGNKLKINRAILFRRPVLAITAAIPNAGIISHIDVPANGPKTVVKVPTLKITRNKRAIRDIIHSGRALKTMASIAPIKIPMKRIAAGPNVGGGVIMHI
jgi:hypothetical protein